MPSARLYLVARVGFGFCWALLTTLSLVYFVEIAGLDPLQMVLLGTALEASVFLFEVPTGIVADAVSRRRSVVIGHVLIGVGWLVTAAFPSFVPLLIAQVIWGVGWTFISGAFVAWLSADVGRERASEVMLHASQWRHGASFVGIGCAVALGQHSLALPLWVGGSGFLCLAVLLALGMRDDRPLRSEAATNAGFDALRNTATLGWRTVRSDRLLLLMLLVTVLYAAFSEGIDRLFTPLVLDQFVLPELPWVGSLGWWGVIAAVGNLIGLVAVRQVRRRVSLSETVRLRRTLAVCLTGIAIGTIALSVSEWFAATLVLFWLVGGLRSAYGPLVSAWLNRRLPDEGKATSLSFYGQADSCGQVAFGPFIGLIARGIGIPIALAVSALVLIPAAWLLGTRKRGAG